MEPKKQASRARAGGRVAGPARPRPRGPGPPRVGGPPARPAGLRALLRDLDGAPFGAYRRLLGRHDLGEFAVVIDRVPPDPFAGAARVRLVADRAKASLPAGLVEGAARRIAVEDFLARAAHEAVSRLSPAGANAPPGSGRMFLEPLGPAVLERSACRITDSEIELRLFVDLPASGRRVRGLRADALFFETLARLATSTLLFSERRRAEAERSAAVVEDHAALQAELERRGLVAFVADGSLLARERGGLDAPARRDGREVAFRAPESLAVTIALPHAGPVRGLGVPAGVTLIVGGAFHGKSTLLDAIASGVQPHRPGDGRERIATRADGVTIRAEDGRLVRRADLSAFFTELPSGDLPADFSSDRASGSTSQAASLVEALEIGSRLLLLDEDTSAMNFMIRDGRMQRLLPRPAEPIVPLIDRLRELYEGLGVSTILVTGGTGDYLEIADTVIEMSAYEARDASARARAVVEATRHARTPEPHPPLRRPAAREPRLPAAAHLRIGLRGPRGVRIGTEIIDLAALEQIAETAQVRSIAWLLREASRRAGPGKTVRDLLGEIDAALDRAGLDAVDPPAAYDLARPRLFELAAALNRWPSLRVVRPDR